MSFNLITKTLAASTLAAALSLGMASQAQANDLSYSWIDVNYVDADSADGFAVRGNVAVGGIGLYLLGSYTNLEINRTRIDIDLWDVGLGYHFAVGSNADLLLEAAYVDADTRFGGVDGYRVSGGVRGGFSDQLEGLFKVNYVDIGSGGGDTSATAGLHYKFSSVFGAVAEAEFGDGDTSWLLGVRARF